MKGEPIEELYFVWLYDQIGSIEITDPSRTWWRLARQLHQKEFTWIIDKDDNRAEDGRDLRREFLEFEGIEEADQDWLDLDCSMFELILALSRHLSYEDQYEGDPCRWFWELLENLDLEKYNDAAEMSEIDVDDILDTVIFRVYKRNGEGGLFPLDRPKKDQREVELWDQKGAYLLEKY